MIFLPYSYYSSFTGLYYMENFLKSKKKKKNKTKAMPMELIAKVQVIIK